MSTEQITVKMIFDRWHALVKQFDTALAALSDEALQKEIAPGKNRGIYLLGHLIAVHDDMIVLLDFGNKIFPEINETFKSADRSVAIIPSAKELRVMWNKMNETLTQHFNSLQPADWFQKHTAVTAEDFIKEPHRNKLNIIITRTSHLAWHAGQFALIN
jgi:hypothetical protein